jgi:hypothetical protein
MDQLKTQIVTMMGLRNAMNPSSNSSDGIMTAIYAIFVLSLIESLFKYMPYVIAFLMKHGERLAKRSVNTLNMPNITNALNEIHSIILVRNYASSSNQPRDIHSPQARTQVDSGNDNDVVDALIEHITNLDNCKHLRFTSRFLINNTDDIQITPEIKVRMDDYQVETDGSVSSMKLKLYSDVVRVSQLREFVDKIYKNFLFEKKNKFGAQRFFFNEIPHHIDRNFDGSIRMSNSPKRLLFNMTPFHTFKSMDNIFGEHLREIKERVDLFINNPEWYRERGIPYTLGIMLYGRPGCGKTSMIKAIAKDSNRHLVNISLRENTTQRQLMNLFFDETVLITNDDGQQTTVIIPIDQRIYVIEDIDCLSQVVYDRASTASDTVVDDVKVKLLTEDQKVDLNAYYDGLLEELEKVIDEPAMTPQIPEMPQINLDMSKEFNNNDFNKMWESSNHDNLNDMLVGAYDGMFGSSIGASINAVLEEPTLLAEPVKPKTSSKKMNIETSIAFIELQRNIHIFDVAKVSVISKLLEDNKSLTEQLMVWVTSNPIEYSLQWIMYCKNNMGAISPSVGNCINAIIQQNEARLPKILKETNTNESKPNDERGVKLAQEDQKKELINLAFLLNLLDGVLETPGRILIITSNYPEKLDKALVRPGRIDVRIKFDYATVNMIKDMLKHFYDLDDKKVASIKIPDEFNLKYSPARVIEAFCNNYNDVNAAIKSLE